MLGDVSDNSGVYGGAGGTPPWTNEIDEEFSTPDRSGSAAATWG